MSTTKLTRSQDILKCLPCFSVLLVTTLRLLMAVENSEGRLGFNKKYKLLAVLVKKGSDQPVACVLSNSFQVSLAVCTMLQATANSSDCWRNA